MALLPSNKQPDSTLSESEHPASAEHPGGFVQRRFVQEFLPFLTSLSLHAAILILGLLTYTAIKAIRAPLQHQTFAADTPLVDASNMPGNVGPEKLFRQTIQSNTPNEDAVTGASSSRGTQRLNLDAAGGEPTDGSASVIAMGLSGAFKGGTTTGMSSGNGGDGAGDGLPAPWGPRPISGGPTSPTFGRPGASGDCLLVRCDWLHAQ